MRLIRRRSPEAIFKLQGLILNQENLLFKRKVIRTKLCTAVKLNKEFHKRKKKIRNSQATKSALKSKLTLYLLIHRPKNNLLNLPKPPQTRIPSKANPKSNKNPNSQHKSTQETKLLPNQTIILFT